MAAAVGVALTKPPAVALCIFASVGIGLSLPYLMLSFAPWTRRILPKPGAWMDTLKQIFAFPMYASAAWLLWVLAQQTSSLGLGAALAGALLIALAAWAYQKSKFSGASGRVVALCTTVVAVALAVLLLALRGCGERRTKRSHRPRGRCLAAIRCRARRTAQCGGPPIAGEFHGELVSHLPGE